MKSAILLSVLTGVSLGSRASAKTLKCEQVSVMGKSAVEAFVAPTHTGTFDIHLESVPVLAGDGVKGEKIGHDVLKVETGSNNLLGKDFDLLILNSSASSFKAFLVDKKNAKRIDMLCHST